MPVAQREPLNGRNVAEIYAASETVKRGNRIYEPASKSSIANEQGYYLARIRPTWGLPVGYARRNCNRAPIAAMASVAAPVRARAAGALNASAGRSAMGMWFSGPRYQAAT